MPFGEKIPYESVEVIHAVGNSANASVAAARLGLASALVANIGDDEDGKENMRMLEKERVSTDLLTLQRDKPSNYHYVLWYEDDRTILVKHQDYTYTLPQLGAPKWIYLSSLGENTLEYQKEIAQYLTNHPDALFAFQPGTYQIKESEQLKDIYARTHIFFANIQEAERILGIDTLGVEELIKRMHELGPEVVILTDGPKGAYVSDKDKVWFQPPYPDPKAPLERTGAGDALASTTVSALALGKDLKTALQWGMINAMSVVQQVGAQKGLLTKAQIEEYMKKASDTFQPKKLS
jgi:ribokinase